METMETVEIGLKSIKELKKLVLTTKKDSKELSQAYSAILKQVEAQTVGVKNPETDETKLILNAAKKELKEQEQSKAAGAPFAEQTLLICNILVKNMSPRMMSEAETVAVINSIISDNENANMGQIMGILKKYSNIDMKIASKLVKELL